MNMFVVCKIQDFEFEPAHTQCFKFPFSITVDRGKMVGYLPVYETREDAREDYPSAKLLEINEV